MKRIIAFLIVVATLTSLTACFINKIEEPAFFDYMSEDLSRYVEVPKSVYDGYAAIVLENEPTEMDVEFEIIKELNKHRTKNDNTGNPLTDIVISAGDEVNIRYHGYFIENGKKVYIENGSNLYATEDFKLRIGSGTVIPGIEYGIIGKNPSDYGTLTVLKSGLAQSTDILKVTYFVKYSGEEKAMRKSTYIDPSDPDLDSEWGVGFTAFLTSKQINIGSSIISQADPDDDLVLTKQDGEVVYSAFEVDAAFRASGAPLVLEAYYPANYVVQDLRGKNCYFEVYINSVNDYDVPELDAKFIMGNLKMEEKTLEGYKGATVVEKYRAYVMEDLMKKYKLNVRYEIINQFLNQAMENVTFKSLPEEALDMEYDSVYAPLEIMYKTLSVISERYPTIDEYICAHYGLPVGSDYTRIIRSIAENTVKEKLIVYSVIKAENLSLTEEAKEQLISEYDVDMYDDSISVSETTDSFLKVESSIIGDITVAPGVGSELIYPNVDQNITIVPPGDYDFSITITNTSGIDNTCVPQTYHYLDGSEENLLYVYALAYIAEHASVTYA